LKHVVIIGGGFCGAITAVNLARLTDAPLRVTVLNSIYPLARGIAYGTRRPEHLLNVVARNMSALADQPDHFLAWLGTRSDIADIPQPELRERFMPRRMYGDYLQSLFLWYSRALADGKKVRIEHVEAEALDVVPTAGRVTVVATDGVTLEADKVVLATGNQVPTDLPGCSVEHAHYFRNPWADWELRLPDSGSDVILLGTGLTTVDAFLTLTGMGWKGKIYAVSRRGLLPLSHFKGAEYHDFPESDPSNIRLDDLVALLDKHRERMKNLGLNPAILVDKLRPFTQRIWRNFTLDEKQRFKREYATRWNVVRHRIAQSIHRQLMIAIESQQLTVVKGAVRSIRAADDGGLSVEIRDRDGNTSQLRGAAVINCTGPAEGYNDDRSFLYRNLLGRGLVAADELNMGIRADEDFVVVEPTGSRSQHLLALGPPLKGELWESIAVPELRNQAFRVAETIIADLQEKRADIGRLTSTFADVTEYSI
jgi:uncharacterized NAD(P)/FAD-binding protein YdhS